MAEYSVAVQVQKQASTEACWASVVAPVLSAAQPGPHESPDAMYASWHNANGKTAQNPIEVLAHYGVATDVAQFAAAPLATAAARQARADAIEQVVVAALRDGIPVICGLRPHGDTEIGSTGRRWRHAVLIYKCDDTAHTCHFKDPSPGGSNAAQADRAVSFRGLASGFDYMAKESLGMAAREHFGVTGDGNVHARAYRLIVARRVPRAALAMPVLAPLD